MVGQLVGRELEHDDWPAKMGSVAKHERHCTAAEAEAEGDGAEGDSAEGGEVDGRPALTPLHPGIPTFEVEVLWGQLSSPIGSELSNISVKQFKLPASASARQVADYEHSYVFDEEMGHDVHKASMLVRLQIAARRHARRRAHTIYQGCQVLYPER
jgi:hypothetical protein